MIESTCSDNVDSEGTFSGICKPKENEPAPISGSVEVDDYSFEFPKKGKCYIFNHKVFDKKVFPDLPERTCTDKDKQDLYLRFRALGFEQNDIIMYDDLTVQEVNSKLKEAGKEDYSDYSCLVCCVLSHGNKGIIHAKDGVYFTKNIFQPFIGNQDHCDSLVGKPKIFFIQACQGLLSDGGRKVVYKESQESLDNSLEFKLPTMADFLIVYATVPGHISFRRDKGETGSWFIQALCSVLKKHAYDRHLLDILTVVNREVAFKYESCTKKPETNKKKQVPFIQHTLTRNINFFQKK